MRFPILVLLAALAAGESVSGVPNIGSFHADSDFALTADPEAPQWKGTPGIFMDSNQFGKPLAGYRSEVRSRWTDRFLYLLYVCPYEQLYVHQHPQTAEETRGLWDWDVAEAFIGTDFKNTDQYYEFEVSPQGEWIALGVDLKRWIANSSLGPGFGLEVRSRIDERKKIWYGEMRIPLAKIGIRPPSKGIEVRINLFRIQGPPPRRNYIAWQPTKQWSFHAPEAFGRLTLE
ncbi:MAG: carbohydrate-binding family 9-like protein [Bryobacteraceae bacterium]